jgi:hypothetical protein
LHVLLRREGWCINHKRTYRVYRAAGLAVRRRKRKRIAGVERQPKVVALALNQSWSMTFMNTPAPVLKELASVPGASTKYCKTIATTFVPEAGKDYEGVLDIGTDLVCASSKSRRCGQ